MAGIPGQFYSRLLGKEQSNTSGDYCVQYDVVSHNRERCDLQSKEVACTRCTFAGRACSKLILHDGELKMAWLPLPIASRLEVAWGDLRCWNSPKPAPEPRPKKGVSRR